MRNILSIILVALTVCVASAKDCGYSLYNLFVSNGHNINGAAGFRACADSVASAHGLVYDMSASGNIAIIEAICQEQGSKEVDVLINNALSVVTTSASEVVVIDTTGMSAFQVDYAVNECVKQGVSYTFINGDVLTMQDSPVLTIQGTVCGVSKTTVVDANGMSMTVPFSITPDTVKYADDYEDFTIFTYRVDGVNIDKEDTLWHVSNKETHYVPDTVHTMDTITSSFCACEGQPMSVLWAQYMVELPKAIKAEKDKGAKALLSACRIKIGRIVRGEHRYGGKIEDTSKSTSSVKKHNHARTVSSAKASKAWYNIRMWFKRTFRINKCAKKHHRM
jgi:hypothetical protein